MIQYLQMNGKKNKDNVVMTTGYSGRPLAAKLGLKPGFRALFISAPEAFPLLLGDAYESLLIDPASSEFEYIHWFVLDQAEYIERFLEIKGKLVATGMLWVSWPKKSSHVVTDVTETIVRDVALANGLVDVKICAIDTIWSGLKLMYRIKDR